MSNSLRPYGPQHARPPCLSPTSRVYPNPFPLSWWCHPTISSSVIPFSCPPSFPAVGSFQMSQLFVIRWPKYWSFSFNISPSNEHPGLISFRWTGWISLQSKGLSKSLLQHHSSKASINSYYLVDNNSYYLIELHIYFLFIIFFSIFHIFDPKNIFL